MCVGYGRGGYGVVCLMTKGHKSGWGLGVTVQVAIPVSINGVRSSGLRRRTWGRACCPILLCGSYGAQRFVAVGMCGRPPKLLGVWFMWCAVRRAFSRFQCTKLERAIHIQIAILAGARSTQGHMLYH